MQTELSDYSEATPDLSGRGRIQGQMSWNPELIFFPGQ